jgi:excisionase family DNA binding protein
MSTDRQAPTTISVAETARQLSVPEPTVRGWILRGILPSLRIGGRRLIRVADLNALLHGQKEGQGAA